MSSAPASCLMVVLCPRSARRCVRLQLLSTAARSCCVSPQLQWWHTLRHKAWGAAAHFLWGGGQAQWPTAAPQTWLPQSRVQPPLRLCWSKLRVRSLWRNASLTRRLCQTGWTLLQVRRTGELDKLLLESCPTASRCRASGSGEQQEAVWRKMGPGSKPWSLSLQSCARPEAATFLPATSGSACVQSGAVPCTAVTGCTACG